LILERIRKLIQEDGLSFAEAKQVAQATQIFTTHTPVSAGFDLFRRTRQCTTSDSTLKSLACRKKNFWRWDEKTLAIYNHPSAWQRWLLRLPALSMGSASAWRSFTGDVSGLWANLPLVEVPISAITNGVHARSVVAKSYSELYDRYLGPSWSEKGTDDPLWERVASLPDEELWRNHERCRSELVVYVRERMQKHLRDRGATPAEIAQAHEVLDPSVLTFGFARRFATYKRANLFMRDMDRIKKIMRGNKDRQLQFVIAGKAHPKDTPGKELIREIIHQIRKRGLATMWFSFPTTTSI
jgi:starch phosphorylase